MREFRMRVSQGIAIVLILTSWNEDFCASLDVKFEILKEKHKDVCETVVSWELLPFNSSRVSNSK